MSSKLKLIAMERRTKEKIKKNRVSEGLYIIKAKKKKKERKKKKNLQYPGFAYGHPLYY